MNGTHVHQAMKPETATVIGCIAFTIALAMFAGAIAGGWARYDDPFTAIGAFACLVMAARYWQLWLRQQRKKSAAKFVFRYTHKNDDRDA